MSDKIIKTGMEIDKWFSFLPEKVDLWITDPPYPFDNRNGGGRFKFVKGVDSMYSRLNWKELEAVFDKMYQQTNDGGRCYVFCNRDGLFELKPILEKVGWTFRNVLVWDKVSIGLGYYWRSQIEYIVYASKGKVKKYVRDHPNVFKFKKPSIKDAIPSIGYTPSNISSKPHKIWSTILEKDLADGEVVADPFAGSDPMSAALKLNPDLLKKIKTGYMNTFGD